MNGGQTANSIWARKIPGRIGVTAWLVGFAIIFMCELSVKEFGDLKRDFNPTSRQAMSDREKLSVCRSQLLTSLHPSVVGLDLLRDIHVLCYSQVSEEDNLQDFDIRRTAFEYQQKATGILMWMVVAITISGVLLAAIQLIIGYKLAASGKVAAEQSSKINVEAHRLSVNSSVVGVAILFLSLLFFFVYVRYVYTITEFKDAPTVSSTPPMSSTNSGAPSVPCAPKMMIKGPLSTAMPPCDPITPVETGKEPKK